MRAVLVFLLVLALVSSAILLVLDASDQFRHGEAHRIVSALPLAAIAFACLLYHLTWSASWLELLQRGLLSAAFLCWAASQLFPDTGWAPVANDVAIGLFVLDLATILWGDLRRRFAAIS